MAGWRGNDPFRPPCRKDRHRIVLARIISPLLVGLWMLHFEKTHKWLASYGTLCFLNVSKECKNERSLSRGFKKLKNYWNRIKNENFGASQSWQNFEKIKNSLKFVRFCMVSSQKLSWKVQNTKEISKSHYKNPRKPKKFFWNRSHSFDVMNL